MFTFPIAVAKEGDILGFLLDKSLGGDIFLIGPLESVFRGNENSKNVSLNVLYTVNKTVFDIIAFFFLNVSGELGEIRTELWQTHETGEPQCGFITK